MSENKEALLSSFATMLQLNKLTVEDLVAHLAGTAPAASADAETIAHFATVALTSLSVNTARSYATHFSHLINGVARQCTCVCAACVQEFSTAGTCHCQCTTCKKALAFDAQGDVVITARAIKDINLDVLVKLVQLMAVKRAMHDNLTRSRSGLSAKPTHGQGAREMCVTAMRYLFARMVKGELISVSPASELTKGRRSQPRRRALSDVELAQVFSAVASAGDDPLLDLALTWSEFELGARRGGIISLCVGLIDLESQMVTLHEKGNTFEAQPCSRELINFLMDFAAQRGGDTCIPGSPTYDPNAAVFYFKDSTPQRPHRMTGRRFDTLHRRIQLTLPWANSMSYSGHALRHTIGTMVERLAGYETARRTLRHGGESTTGTYVKAGTADVARAVSAITGSSHPLATEPEGH